MPVQDISPFCAPQQEQISKTDHSEQARALRLRMQRTHVCKHTISRREKLVDDGIFRTVAPQEKYVSKPTHHSVELLEGVSGAADGVAEPLS
jgi:hypothetical protein